MVTRLQMQLGENPLPFDREDIQATQSEGSDAEDSEDEESGSKFEQE
jgi:hypothetical protein